MKKKKPQRRCTTQNIPSTNGFPSRIKYPQWRATELITSEDCILIAITFLVVYVKHTTALLKRLQELSRKGEMFRDLSRNIEVHFPGDVSHKSLVGKNLWIWEQ